LAEDKDQENQNTPDKGAEQMSEDEIDKTLADTFPASDPPSWTLGTDHRNEQAGEKPTENSTAGETPEKE
jgi:hypothetical protein